MNYILFNPHSGLGKSKECATNINRECEGDSTVVDMTEVNYRELFEKVNERDTVTVLGGDGTLNRFINETDGIKSPARIFYYPAGTGNDFYADICDVAPEHPVDITDYVKELPTVTLEGKDHKFINGVGYGIDGYCCEVGDKLRAAGKTKVNYAAIAVKGLLFHYKPTGATITVDGVKHRFEKVWLAPVMKGKHYGGGMTPAPEQDRFDSEGRLSVFVFHGSGKLRTLMIFPKIFSGDHVKHTDVTKVLTGNEITVEFDSPRALQIDGETVLDVKRFTASSAKERVIQQA